MARPPRLSAAALADHLALESAATSRLVHTLRRAILSAAPAAAEAIKFHALCYYHADAYFGSIGGNICMIEVKKDKVSLAFIHGSQLPDPQGLLQGELKSRRRVPIPDAAAARSPQVAALVRAAAGLRPWD